MTTCPRPDLPRHTTYVDYRRGCRCPAAREDRRLYEKRWREGRARPRLTPSTGSLRRVRALTSLGWTNIQIARESGVSTRTLDHLKREPTTYQTTADAIRRTYDRLSMTKGPSNIARAYAHRHGWAPPLAWDDDTIDNPEARPHRPRSLAAVTDTTAIEQCAAGLLHASKLNAAGRRAVVERLNHLTAARIAEITGMSTRTVDRARTSIARTTSISAA